MNREDPKFVAEEDCEDEELEEEIPKTMLKEGISLQDVVDASAVFEVDTNFSEEKEQEFTYFDKEELLKCNNRECVDVDEDESGDKVELGKTPFEKIASQMISISEDGKVKKRVIKPGHGTVVPEGAYVTIHYNGYVEYGDEPFDSTWLRARSKVFKLNIGAVIQGLDMAVATMKKGERSRFLIHPDLGFGKLGCSPRIPPDAELLFDVELIDYDDTGAAAILNTLTLDEYEKQDFSVILKAAKSFHLQGSKLYGENKPQPAVKKYRRAMNMLEKCHLKDKFEEAEQQKELQKIYVNLAICYNKLMSPQLACTACKSALAINPKNVKALFNYGRALLILSDYNAAKSNLLKAQKLEPKNKEITEELKKVDRKQNIYNSDVKSFSQRAFQSNVSSENKVKVEKAEVPEKFQEELIAQLTEFTSCEKKTMYLPPQLTAQEELCVRQAAGERGLTVRSIEQRGGMQLCLSKPE